MVEDTLTRRAFGTLQERSAYVGIERDDSDPLVFAHKAFGRAANVWSVLGLVLF